MGKGLPEMLAEVRFGIVTVSCTPSVPQSCLSWSHPEGYNASLTSPETAVTPDPLVPGVFIFCCFKEDSGDVCQELVE